MKLEVVGLGVSCIDYTAVVEDIPGVDETAVMLDFRKQMGGPVAVALATYSYLGGDGGYIGKIGDDDNGMLIRRTLRKFKVDTECVIEEKGGQTPFSFILIEKRSGRRTIIFNPGCIFNFDFSECDVNYIKSAKFILLDGVSIGVAMKAAEWAKSNSIKVVLDPGINAPGIGSLINMSSIVIASKNFVLEFTNETNVGEGVKKIKELGPEVVVATLGENGSICLTNEETFHQPAFKVKAVETTGAGDVFHGAFLFGLVKGWNLREIIKFSSAVAALKCTKFGGVNSIPNYEEVSKFLKEGV